MTGTKRIRMWIVFVLLAFLVMAGMVYYLTPGWGAPTIGVVQLEQVVTHHPQYEEYKQLKDTYESMKQTYQIEQQTLQQRLQQQGQSLQQAALASGFDQSLQDEFRAKMTVKEQALNVKLQQRYMELLAQYRKEMQTTPSEADLQIVNLQLQLQGYVEPLALLPEDREANAKRREEMQAELTRLLAERQPAIRRSMQALDERIAKELQPMREAGERELAAYAKEVQQELLKRKQQASKEAVNRVMGQTSLPAASTWNQAWNQKLTAQKDTLDALHDAMVEDIRNRASVIQKQKHLTIVLVDMITERNCVDITQDIIATYQHP